MIGTSDRDLLDEQAAEIERLRAALKDTLAALKREGFEDLVSARSDEETIEQVINAALANE